MAGLNIRNLPSEVHARLRVRAATAGRSMEAEARLILESACLACEPAAAAEDLRDWVDRLYRKGRPRRVVEGLLAERRREAAAEVPLRGAAAGGLASGKPDRGTPSAFGARTE